MTVENVHGDDEFVRTDIPTDVLASIELLALALGRVSSEPGWWKWVVVASHMAVSTSLVGYLTMTNGAGALTNKSTKELIRWYEARDGFPIEYLAEFPELLRRAASGKCGFGEPIEISPRLVTDLCKLNTVRNGFNHFLDQGWSIEIAYVVPFVRSALSLISLIAGHGWAFRHAETQVRLRLALLLDECGAMLRGLAP